MLLLSIQSCQLAYHIHFRPITANELLASRNCCLRMCQKASYSDEIRNLRAGESLKGSKIAHLNPILDENHILRSNRRLADATVLSYEEKFPAILKGSVMCRLSRVRSVERYT